MYNGDYQSISANSVPATATPGMAILAVFFLYLQAIKMVDWTAMERCPSGSTRMPRLPVRYARTIRYTLEREQNKNAPISVGFRPAAHNSKMWNASR